MIDRMLTTDLVERWQAGDDGAATEIFERFAPELLAIARAGLGEDLQRRVDPADILQSAFKSFFHRNRQ